MPYFSTMADWLKGITELNTQEMELGLDRTKTLASHLHLSLTCPVITIAGTNGKGSCVAGLEAIYRASGYRVGAFTSPFLFKYNEQVRINGLEVSDEDWCVAFEKVESARQGLPLTSFEFGTLAALVLFQAADLDVCLLEVGLGGRLDAVNIIDAQLTIITSIAIDHVEYLGETREAIAIEKAGIFRPQQLAVCGDASPPKTLIEVAKDRGTLLYCQEKDFHYHEYENHWSFSCNEITYENLPLPKLALENMSTVLMATTLMQKGLPVNREAIDQGLSNVRLAGRIQIIENKIMDVSHNPASIQHLAFYLKKNPCAGKNRAVFSILGDKDIYQSILAIQDEIEEWHIAPLNTKRAASLEMMMKAFQKAGVSKLKTYSDLTEAYQAAQENLNANDRIIVFGSFHTVAEVNGLK